MSVGGNGKGTNKAVNRNAGFNRDAVNRNGAFCTVDGVQAGVELLDKQ